MSAADAIKAIRIKTGSLKRLFRERSMYAEEVKMGKERVERMKSENVDPADLKQQVRARRRRRRTSWMGSLYIARALDCRLTTGVLAQENVLEESEMMVKDNATRLHDAYDSLTATTEHFEADPEVKMSEEYKSALELVAEVDAALGK